MAVTQAASSQPAFSHSRQSSSTSIVSMSSTPPYSTRGYNPWSSSGSSLADSPTMTKSHLGDLAEETEDHEDFSYLSPIEPYDDHICMCDTSFCIHSPKPTLRSTTQAPEALPEWTPGDDATALQRSVSKRRKSSDYSVQALSNKFSRRFPSISSRWRNSQATTSLSSTQVHSVTPPRSSSSLRLPRLRSSLTSVLDTPPRSDRSFSISSSFRRAREESPRRESPVPMNITLPPTPIDEEPIDRQSMSRPPLLPPLLPDMRSNSDDQMIRSPLQSPSVASSAIQSPVAAPVHGVYTPPLSASPSCASFHRHHHTDIPPMKLGVETDPWALRLGHANFHIYPEPYIPEECTKETCQRLLEDWETARTEYMRQAARVSDDYGPNSQTFHFTEEKWAAIDAQWRTNHKLVNDRAEASGEAIRFQALAETAPTQKMPALANAPDAPSKFPVVDESDMVGPMVQYTKISSASPAKKPRFLRIITDSASLLSKTSFNLKR